MHFIVLPPKDEVTEDAAAGNKFGANILRAVSFSDHKFSFETTMKDCGFERIYFLIL